jgi:peptide/nickel transport system substrate-binding protein
MGNYSNINARLDLDPGNKDGFATGLKYLINRETIKTSVLRGLAEIANDQPVPPSNIYYNKELKAKPFDPEKAKFYFQKAGVLGKKIPVVTSEAVTAGVEMAVVLQQAAQDIGLDLDIQRVPSDGYWSKYWLKAPVHFGNINPRPTPDILFSLLYTSDAPWNESQWKSPKFDKLVLEARGTLDQAKRTEMYHEMQRMIAEDAGTVIPVFMGGLDATTSKLHGLRPNPLGGSMGYAFAEYVWLQA